MHPTIRSTSPVDPAPQDGLPAATQPISSLREHGQIHDQDLDRSTQIGCPSADSLSLFRSYSMPIHISSTGSDDEGPLDRTEDVNQDEDDEDYDELLTTPTSQLQLHDPTRYSSYQSSGQRLLSCSLPPSLNRRKSSDIQHEYPLHELLQLTQPMREGVISRERLLPSSRMKQVGIGGRGRRGLSSQRTPGSPSASSTADTSVSPAKPAQAPWSPGSSCSPILPTINLSSSVGSASNPILGLNQQFANPTPLVRPRPIAAWQRPQS